MIEYEDHYRKSMGTESVGPLLRSLVRMVRPNRILEIGAGYTTPFLLEGLEKNEELFDSIFQNGIQHFFELHIKCFENFRNYKIYKSKDKILSSIE